MSGERRLAAVAAVTLLALACAGTAFAATPQKIYRDLTDNGKLDGTYTRAEIERAFKLSPAGRAERRPAAVRKPIAVPAASEAVPEARARGRSDRRGREAGATGACPSPPSTPHCSWQAADRCC
jgi:hypothetical protein